MFNSTMYLLNRIHLAFVAQLVRFVLVRLLPTRERSYVGEIVGYSGWLEVPVLGVLAFRKDDGRLQYKW